MVNSLTALSFESFPQNSKSKIYTPRRGIREQWVGRGNDQDLINNFKEDVGASQKKVGGETVRRLVGLPDHIRVTHRKHSFRSCIRYGCSHPHENRFAHDPDCRTRSK